MKTNGQISVWKNKQILHNNNFHWATVSSNLHSRHSRHGTIDYCDCLFHGRIKDHTKIQIFNLCKSDNLPLQMKIHSCQQQTNGVDYGIKQLRMHFIFQVELT